VKTVATDASPSAFLDANAGSQDRKWLDSLVELMSDATGAAPVVWGDSIVGFGERTYATSAGEQAFFEVGFAPRASSVAIYGVLDADEEVDDLLARIGRHRRTKACLHLTHASDVDVDALRELVDRAVTHWRAGA
jgi:hypothetical protein